MSLPTKTILSFCDGRGPHTAHCLVIKFWCSREKPKLLAESRNTNILMYLSGVCMAAELIEGHGQYFLNGKFFKQVLHSGVHQKMLIQLKATKVNVLKRQGLGKAQKKVVCWMQRNLCFVDTQSFASHSSCLWWCEGKNTIYLSSWILFWIQALVSNLQNLPSKCNTKWKY